jgi:hypothetical protein
LIKITKPNEEVLLSKIAPFFNQYLKQGTFDYRSFTQHIDPNLNIKNLDRLLRIHFILTKKKSENEGKIGVIDFVNDLHTRIRRIKTTVKLNTLLLDGEVRGNIEWCKTIQIRNNRDPKNKTLFVCNQIERDYNIPENLVLKRLLQIIHEIIFIELQNEIKDKNKDKKYVWLKEWVEENELIEVINSVYLKNVYVKRVDLKDVIITDRMINQAKKSRIPLYREAGELLSRYYKLMNYDLDPTEATSLLKNTFIKPNDENKIFELYWIIQIIRQVEDTNVQLELIKEGNKCVANWKHNGYEYEIYHHTPDFFKFVPKTLKQPNLEEGSYFSRECKVFEKYKKLTNLNYFSFLIPDIILTRKIPNKPYDLILVGEVKYTEDESYARQGLKELLTYIALIQEKEGEYIDNDTNVFSSSGLIRGYLFLADVPNFSINDENKCIRCIKFSDDAQNLKEFIRDLRKIDESKY